MIYLPADAAPDPHQNNPSYKPGIPCREKLDKPDIPHHNDLLRLVGFPFLIYLLQRSLSHNLLQNFDCLSSVYTLGQNIVLSVFQRPLIRQSHIHEFRN